MVRLLAPAKTQAAIIARLNDAVVRVTRRSEAKIQFAAQGADLVGSSAEEFAAYICREFEKNSRVVKASGMKVD